eukprot:6309448-Amphidinium_carterae.1
MGSNVERVFGASELSKIVQLTSLSDLAVWCQLEAQIVAGLLGMSKDELFKVPFSLVLMLREDELTELVNMWHADIFGPLMPRLRRELKHDVSHPWDDILLKANEEERFWDTEVRRPALPLLLEAGGAEKTGDKQASLSHTSGAAKRRARPPQQGECHAAGPICGTAHSATGSNVHGPKGIYSGMFTLKCSA